MPGPASRWKSATDLATPRIRGSEPAAACPNISSLTPSVLMAPAVSELPPRLLRTVISAAAPAARLAAPRLIPSLRGIDDAVATSSSSLPCLQQCDNATRALWLRHRTRQRHGLGRAHR